MFSNPGRVAPNQKHSYRRRRRRPPDCSGRSGPALQPAKSCRWPRNEAWRALAAPGSPPAPPPASLSSRAKVRNQSGAGSWATETFSAIHSGRPEAGARGKGRGLSSAVAVSYAEDPGSDANCLAVRPQWPQRMGSELVFALACELACDPPQNPSPSRAEERWGPGVGPRGRRLWFSGPSAAGGIMASEPFGGAAWMATGSPLGGFLGPD